MSAAPKSLNNMEAFWMPFTSNRQFKRNPRLFVGAKDMHYTTDDGRAGAGRDGGPVVLQCRARRARRS